MDTLPQRAHRFHEVNGLRLQLTIWDQPESALAPLLILHGIGARWLFYEPTALRFAATRTVMVLDFRGHGDSEKPSHGYALDDYAADVRGLLDQLPYPHLDLLGHSLGALVAIPLAAESQERLAHVVLEDPPIMVGEEIQPWRDSIRPLLDWKHLPRDQAVQEFHRAIASWNLPLDIHRLAAESFVDTADGPFEELIGGGLDKPDWTPLLSGTHVPTLVLAADPATGIGAQGERQRLYAALPRGKVVDFPGCHHLMEWSCPDRVFETVEAFLAVPVAV
jgi:pimeloyl-ACP methyl ester carboxylesterase